MKNDQVTFVHDRRLSPFEAHYMDYDRYYTICSLFKSCNTQSPRESAGKGWLLRHKYNKYIKSDGQEISTIEWQELKNRFPSFFVHK